MMCLKCLGLVIRSFVYEKTGILISILDVAGSKSIINALTSFSSSLLYITLIHSSTACSQF